MTTYPHDYGIYAAFSTGAGVSVGLVGATVVVPCSDELSGGFVTVGVVVVSTGGVVVTAPESLETSLDESLDDDESLPVSEISGVVVVSPEIVSDVSVGGVVTVGTVVVSVGGVVVSGGVVVIGGLVVTAGV